MTFSYQSTATADTTVRTDESLWQLSAGQALSLPRQPGVRQLRVDTGRLWVTFSLPAQASAARSSYLSAQHLSSSPHEAIDLPLADDDHWLCAGQTLKVPAHAAVVLEGWPQATFSLHVVPPQAQSPQARPTQTQSQRLAQAICGRVGVTAQREAMALT
jgi:Protein of unknown function (DUF2917)